MSKKQNKISHQELSSLGIDRLEWQVSIGIFAKKLIQEGIYTKRSFLDALKNLVNDPQNYYSDKSLKEIALMLSQRKTTKPAINKLVIEEIQYELSEQIKDFPIFGKENIEAEALKQMEISMRLPISIAGALMADAHTGYGLPIGGVLATKSNVVIPYAVGVDIACRMCMTIYDINPSSLTKESGKLKKLIVNNTIFGVGSTNNEHLDTSVFDKSEWNSTKTIRSLTHKAYSQLGTSGAGNHFVEWGILEILKEDELLNVPVGKYLALLSHSGSRGFGNEIAEHYSKLAMNSKKLPSFARHLAWLELDSEEGQEYWTAMNLAGDYASANHHEIHSKIAKELGITPVRLIENHHNFAWKEKLADGTPVIVHRKGATPAGKNNIGIIPGSMTDCGFIVRGKSNYPSLNSASHGAGRVMSRTKAFNNITREEMMFAFKEKGVELIGGDIDESPMVYKDINQVMSFQQDLVDILARFTPKIVRMAEPERRRRKG